MSTLLNLKRLGVFREEQEGRGSCYLVRMLTVPGSETNRPSLGLVLGMRLTQGDLAEQLLTAFSSSAGAKSPCKPDGSAMAFR